MLRRRDLLISLGATALHPGSGHKVISRKPQSLWTGRPEDMKSRPRSVLSATSRRWTHGTLRASPEFESEQGITLQPLHISKTSILDLPAHGAGVVWKQ